MRIIRLIALNATGYDKMARVWHAAIRAILARRLLRPAGAANEPRVAVVE